MTEHKARIYLERICDNIYNGNQAAELELSSIGERIVELCKTHPNLALEPCGFCRFLPLELLIVRRSSVDSIKEFCNLFPKALTVKSDAREGRLPLHLACERFPGDVCPDVIKLLASQHPEAASVTDSMNNLPFHLLLRHMTDEEISHLAIRGEAFDVIDDLAANYPQSIVSIDPGTKKIPISYGYTRNFPAKILNCFVKHLHRLETISVTLNESNFEEEAVRFFFRAISTSSNVKKLHLELSPIFLEGNAMFQKSLLELLPEVITVTSLVLSFPKLETHFPPHRHNWESLNFCIAEPVSALIYSGSLAELILKDGITIQPEPIMEALVNNPDFCPETLDIRCFDPSYEMSQLIADVIGANGNLRSLSLSNISIQCRRLVFRALAHNTRLKTLVLPNIIAPSTNEAYVDDYDCLSKVLRKHNTTLEQIRCYPAAIVDVEGVEYKSMQYYVHLNRRGRAQTRRDDFTCADLVKLLMALNYRDNAMLGICFGLLLECPVTWSSNRYV